MAQLRHPPTSTDFLDRITRRAHPLTGEASQYDRLLEEIGDARLVLIGEGSHGTHEFYRERADITRRLIEEKHFDAVAAEADWPDAFRVNRYVTTPASTARPDSTGLIFTACTPRSKPSSPISTRSTRRQPTAHASATTASITLGMQMPEAPLEDVIVPVSQGLLYGSLAVPARASGLVVFAHGSGSSRFSSRNRDVAHSLHQAGFGTLLFDLLTESEEALDQRTREHRFNIPLLGERLVIVTDWLRGQTGTQDLDIGYFGASTGAAAALTAAAERPDVRAVVSRGGRPDLAEDALDQVQAPTLLIVGELDTQVIQMNTDAKTHLQGTSELVIIPGATHLFEEPGTMEQVTHHAENWFRRYLGDRPDPSRQ